MDTSLALGAPPSLSSILSAGPTTVFLDFDGTLVELAPGPDAIRPREGLAKRLKALANRLDHRAAIVSGRAIADIEKHTGPLSLAIAGSHGSDIRTADGSALGSGPDGFPDAMAERMRAFAQEEGLDYEAKPHGGALHYRARPDLGARADTFARELAAEFGWSAQGGKAVVEIVSRTANKGAAVDALMSKPPFAGSRPFFLGDDLTDEAGFKAVQNLGGAGVLIGERENTEARYRLPDVSSVHDWLEL